MKSVYLANFKDIMKKIRKILLLNPSVMHLFLEAYWLLGWARILKSIPFARVAPTLGEKMGETPYRQNPEYKEMLQKISEAIEIMSQYTWWESKCLVKAIAGMKMLERRQIESTLYLGTARDRDGKMIAHAWLRSGTYYVSGREGKERFTVVAKFAKRLKETKVD